MHLEEIAESLLVTTNLVLRYRSHGQILGTPDISHLDGYALADKTRLPEEYALAADSILLMEQHTALGGVLFVKNKALFRTCQLIDTPIRYENPAIEMNGLYIDPSVPQTARIAFWAAVCVHLRKQQGFIYFSYDMQKKGLDNFYKTFPGIPLYEGPVKAIPGMPGEGVERIVECDLAKFNTPGVMERLLLAKMTGKIREAEHVPSSESE